ncbi:MAG: MTAP family purine nucleoside phosphorylase [Desulfovibrio sp.]|nr:MTAP family purine nucleoside phosphorylase [Desulfovibrio sp.]
MNKLIGVIGGTGLDNPELFLPEAESFPDTPFGKPSSPLRTGVLKGSGTRIVLLARHGLEHTIPPHRVNYRANLYALHKAGCTQIVASACCGSLQDQFGPGSLVVPDQFIDFTRQRRSTFFDRFEPGDMRHQVMAQPFAQPVRQALLEACRTCGIEARDGGCIVTIEGPRFSTKAESRMFRLLGGDLINMTIATECILANEIGLPYGVVAMVTDYDSWSEEHPALTLEELLAVLASNSGKFTRVLAEALKHPV